MKKTVLASVALAAMMIGGTASASTFLKLTNDQCTGTCGLSGGASYGQVKIDGLGTNVVTFDVKLAANIFFNNAGGAKPEMFSLTDGAASTSTSGPFPFANAPSLAFSNITTGFNTATGANPPTSETAKDLSSIGAWGDFMYSVIWVGPPNNNSSPSANELKFTVTGPSGSQLQLDADVNTHKIGSGKDKTTAFDSFGTTYFIADLYGANGKTGYVGAVLDDHGVPQGGVPEPASWALMLLGFGGLGSMLRQRRAARAVAA